MTHIHRPQLATILAFCCLLLPMLGVHLAYAINIGAGEVESCNPYLDGCITISHAVRTGPGLPIFRAILIPSAVAMIVVWLLLGDWLRLHRQRSGKVALLALKGVLGGAVLIAYAAWLGHWGSIYEFMRSYLIFGYFGFTALAQLFLLSVLWPIRASLLEGRAYRLVVVLYGLCAVMLTVGLAFAFRQFYLDDFATQEQVGKSLEWILALLLHTGFVGIAGLFWYAPMSLTSRLH